jgi:hypothetical protein
MPFFETIETSFGRTPNRVCIRMQAISDFVISTSMPRPRALQLRRDDGMVRTGVI